MQGNNPCIILYNSVYNMDVVFELDIPYPEADAKTLFVRDDKKDIIIVGVYPNDNTATVWLNTKDLMDIIREHGNDVKIW